MSQQVRRLLWRFVAQRGELRFHQRNEWRQSVAFMEQTARLFQTWGFSPDDFSGRLVVDIGAGSRLRSRYFVDARIAAIEPLADRFRRTIAWSDLDSAQSVYAVPAEQRVDALAEEAALVMCINVLDHVFDPSALVANAASYLSSDGRLLLSVDLHQPGHAGHMHPVHLDEPAVARLLADAGLVATRDFHGLLGEADRGYGHGVAYTVIARRGQR